MEIQKLNYVSFFSKNGDKSRIIIFGITYLKRELYINTQVASSKKTSDVSSW